MTFHYDSELERIMIQGTTWGGQDVGTTYGDTGRLWELSFVYDGVVDHGDYVEVAAGGSNTGMLRDTVNNVTKAAVLETGLELQVPLFINEGERLVIDTRESRYIRRAK